MATINSAAMSKVESVRPEMGLFEEPIMPTRLPETAAKKKPVMAITMAAMTAAVTFPENQKYTAIIASNATARPPKTTRMFMSRSRRLVAAAARGAGLGGP